MKKLVLEPNMPGQKILMLSYQKIFLPLLDLFNSMIANQTNADRLSLTTQKEISVQTKFQEAEINGEVTVMLTDRPVDGLLLEGTRKDLDSVKAAVKKGKLVINAGRKRTADTLIVYISVKDVRSLIINGDARIFSSGTIKTNELGILLNGISLVAVHYEGKVNITAGMGYEFADNLN